MPNGGGAHQAIRTLNPGYFAPVMDSADVSIAMSNLAGARTVPPALTWALSDLVVFVEEAAEDRPGDSLLR